MAVTSLPCGDCTYWRGPAPTHDIDTRPLGYCGAYLMWRLAAEVVDGCTYALDARDQRAFDPEL